MYVYIKVLENRAKQTPLPKNKNTPQKNLPKQDKTWNTLVASVRSLTKLLIYLIFYIKHKF